MFDSVILVRVLVGGVYNGRGHRALPTSDVGDLIEVAGGGYGESLMADGYVTDELAPPETAPVAPALPSIDTHEVISQVAAEGQMAEIHGVGAATAKLLIKHGVDSWHKLVEADTAVLAKAIGKNETQVAGWQASAVDLLNEYEESA